jgi:hypothetical protein
MSESNNADALVLHWPGKLFSADDLRRHWKDQRELVLSEKALLTPLAMDELRAKGVRITRQGGAVTGIGQGRDGNAWAYVEEQPYAAVAAAVASLERQGLSFQARQLADNEAAAWLGLFRDWRTKKQNGFVFCADAALLCCLANKSGLRAAAVFTARQAARAMATIGANVLIVEMPGPTFFEIRQIMSTTAKLARVCAAEFDKVLTELDGHAHR